MKPPILIDIFCWGFSFLIMSLSLRASDPPNIVIIMADDMGACDLGAYGNADAETPHLDRLAAESIRHEAFYVTPVCAPTRAELLTGRKHLRVGVSQVHGGKDHIQLDETLLPEYLKSVDYATGTWGKWHSGTSEGYLPHQRGFDETLLLQLYRHRDPIGTTHCGEKIRFDGRWGDEVIVDHALDFAERHRDRPFLALVASMTPHSPLDAPEEEVQRMMRKRHLSRKVAILHAQMAVFDRAMGRLMDGLGDLDTGGRETLVFFFSDNGPAMFEDDFTDADRDRRNMLGWRGWKGDVWEAGIRSPLFVHRLGQTASGRIDQPAQVADLLPTILDYAGVEADPEHFDGRSIRPLFEGGTLPEAAIATWVHPAIPPAPGRGEKRRLLKELNPVPPEAKAYLRAADQVMALRLGDWKLTRNADINRPGGPYPERFLANVVTDPRETTDLTDRAAETADALEHRMLGWFEEMRAAPHSFAAPELQVPAEDEVVLRASWNCFLSDSLFNSVANIEGFNRAGQIARWSLNVAATRDVRPEFVWFRRGATMPEGSRIALRCGGAEVFGTAGADGNLDWDGSLTLDAGPNTLELEILALPEIGSDLDLSFVNLRAVEGPT